MKDTPDTDTPEIRLAEAWNVLGESGAGLAAILEAQALQQIVQENNLDVIVLDDSEEVVV